METTIVYWGYIGVFRTIYWGYIGIMENKMETTIVYWGSIGVSTGFRVVGFGALYGGMSKLWSFFGYPKY